MFKKESKFNAESIFAKFVSKQSNIEKIVLDTNNYDIRNSIFVTPSKRNGNVPFVVVTIQDQKTKQILGITLESTGITNCVESANNESYSEAEAILKIPKLLTLYKSFAKSMIEIGGKKYYDYLNEYRNKKIQRAKNNMVNSEKAISWLNTQLKANDLKYVTNSDLEGLLSREKIKLNNCENIIKIEYKLSDALRETNQEIFEQ